MRVSHRVRESAEAGPSVQDSATRRNARQRPKITVNTEAKQEYEPSRVPAWSRASAFPDSPLEASAIAERYSAMTKAKNPAPRSSILEGAASTTKVSSAGKITVSDFGDLISLEKEQEALAAIHAKEKQDLLKRRNAKERGITLEDYPATSLDQPSEPAGSSSPTKGSKRSGASDRDASNRDASKSRGRLSGRRSFGNLRKSRTEGRSSSRKDKDEISGAEEAEAPQIRLRTLWRTRVGDKPIDSGAVDMVAEDDAPSSAKWKFWSRDKDAGDDADEAKGVSAISRHKAQASQSSTVDEPPLSARWKLPFGKDKAEVDEVAEAEATLAKAKRAWNRTFRKRDDDLASPTTLGSPTTPNLPPSPAPSDPDVKIQHLKRDLGEYAAMELSLLDTIKKAKAELEEAEGRKRLKAREERRRKRAELEEQERRVEVERERLEKLRKDLEAEEGLDDEGAEKRRTRLLEDFYRQKQEELSRHRSTLASPSAPFPTSLRTSTPRRSSSAWSAASFHTAKSARSDIRSDRATYGRGGYDSSMSVYSQNSDEDILPTAQDDDTDEESRKTRLYEKIKRKIRRLRPMQTSAPCRERTQ